MNPALSATTLAALALAQGGYVSHSSYPGPQKEHAIPRATMGLGWGSFPYYREMRTGTAEFHPAISQRQRRIRARRQGGFPVRR